MGLGRPRDRQGHRRRSNRGRSGKAQGALWAVRAHGEYGAADLDADRADFRHGDQRQGT